MTDIVERLRDPENEHIFSDAEDGADEIEQLRVALENITSYAEHVLGAFKNGRGYLDMTGFHTHIKNARALVSDSEQK